MIRRNFKYSVISKEYGKEFIWYILAKSLIRNRIGPSAGPCGHLWIKYFTVQCIVYELWDLKLFIWYSPKPVVCKFFKRKISKSHVLKAFFRSKNTDILFSGLKFGLILFRKCTTGCAMLWPFLNPYWCLY